MILVVVVLVVVGVGFLVSKKNKEQGYSVVYLTSGEVYIGKLTTFPDFSLSDSHQLQMVKSATDASKNGFQLSPVNEAVWAPEVLHLIKDNVVFYGPLMSNSKIAETLAGQGK